MTKALLESGAETEKSTREGATPLHMASLQGNVEVVQSLLQAMGLLDFFGDHGIPGPNEMISSYDFIIRFHHVIY